MSKTVQAASFEDFLKSPSRLAAQDTIAAKSSSEENPAPVQPEALSSNNAPHTKASAQKRKVGLTIDADIIDAIDDYIYYERKQGHRLKKNDVYEAALRQFLGLEGGDAQ